MRSTRALGSLTLLNALLILGWHVWTRRALHVAAQALPLFPATWNHSIPTLHTSFATLLPHLPAMASGDSSSLKRASASTLVVTLATDQFQHLLFNFLCFMHHRLDPELHPPGKYLVVSSSEKLAHYLAARGVVVLYLKREQEGLFSNLQKLDLMLSAEVLAPLNVSEGKEVIAWGSLHYQALMLERTLVTTTLVGMLAQSNSMPDALNTTCLPVDKRYDPEQPSKRRQQVGGVLLVDNDAVWYVSHPSQCLLNTRHRLSSPSSMIHSHYASLAESPSYVYASDIHPADRTTWHESQLACACFFYSRTADVHQAADSCTGAQGYDGTAAENAALGWRHVSLCHIQSTLESLEQAAESAAWYQDGATMSTLREADAPSFQHSSLGPVTYLGKNGLLPYVSQEEFARALDSGDVGDLQQLLKKVGLGPGEPSCVERANRLSLMCPAPDLRTSLVAKYRPVIRSGVLPYSHFPPGRSYFTHEEREASVEPCVVHANYALKHWKEKLMRKYGLWALQHDAGQEAQCDKEVLERSFSQWQRANVSPEPDPDAEEDVATF
jgi:hypothetical protein